MQRADMLIFESVNCLANKNKLQGEFFNIINSLYDNNKQIVLTSDRLPCKIKGLNSNLLSRFENMFIVKLYPPDLEARLAILKKKQEEKKIILDDEIMLFIAKRIKSNIRCLEGALISLNAFSSLTGIPVNMVNVEKLLKPFSF